MTRRRFRGSRLLALPFSAELFCLTSVLSYQFPFFLVSAHCILFRVIIFNLPVWLCFKNELPAVSGEGLPPVTPLASHRPREHLRARPGRLLYLAPPGDSTHFQGRVEQRPCSRCGCRAHGSSARAGRCAAGFACTRACNSHDSSARRTPGPHFADARTEAQLVAESAFKPGRFGLRVHALTYYTFYCLSNLRLQPSSGFPLTS